MSAWQNYTGSLGGANMDKAEASSPEKASSGSMPANLHSKILKYPLDLENANGHYMIFNIYTRTDVKTEMPATDLNISTDTLQTFNDTFTRERFFDDVSSKDGSGGILNSKPVKLIKDTIVLYMPDNVSVSYTSNYEQGELGLISGTGALIGDIRKSNTTVIDSLKSAGMQSAAFVQSILSLGTTGDTGGAMVALQRKTGLAAAPLQEMIFKSLEFRQFEYSFSLTPRNRKEAKEIKDIIDTFTYHMLPEKLGTGAAIAFRVPAEFTIRYMYRGHDNNYLNQLTYCALENMKVNYGGSEKYVTYRPDDTGAPPVRTEISLTFKELELVDKRRASRGTHETTLRSGGADTF